MRGWIRSGLPAAAGNVNSSAPDIHVGLSAASGISSVDALHDAVSDLRTRGFPLSSAEFPHPGVRRSLRSRSLTEAHSLRSRTSVTEVLPRRKGKTQQQQQQQQFHAIHPRETGQPGYTRCAPANERWPVGLAVLPAPTRPEQQTAYHTLPWEPSPCGEGRLAVKQLRDPLWGTACCFSIA